MKKANSNHAALRPEDQLRGATAKALAAEKAATEAKEKARSAKRRFKTARKSFKQAKKAAKKALKCARRAQDELKACVDNAGIEKRRTTRLIQHSALRKPKVTSGSATPNLPKRKPMPPKRKAVSPTGPVEATRQSTSKSSVPPTQELGSQVEPVKPTGSPSGSQG